MEGRTAGKDIGWLAGGEELPIDSRGRPDGPGHRRPKRSGRTRRPTGSSARLDFEAGVVVVLDLCAEAYVQPLGNECDLVLDEPIDPRSLHLCRQESQG